jgi:hypothetical protein
MVMHDEQLPHVRLQVGEHVFGIHELVKIDGARYQRLKRRP